ARITDNADFVSALSRLGGNQIDVFAEQPAEHEVQQSTRRYDVTIIEIHSLPTQISVLVAEQLEPQSGKETQPVCITRVPRRESSGTSKSFELPGTVTPVMFEPFIQSRPQTLKGWDINQKLATSC